MFEQRTVAFPSFTYPREHHIMLNSGGMDSLLVHHNVFRRNIGGSIPGIRTLFHSEDTFVSVFADYDQSYSEKERLAARAIATAYGIPLVVATCAPLALYEHISGIVPFRNAELLLAAAQEGATGVTNVMYMGVLAHEVNSDKSRAFLRHMKGVLNVSHRAQYWTEGKRYTMRTPLRRMTKTEAVANYLATGGSKSLLLRTVSCYSPTELPCGRCASCFKRWVALINNDLTQDFLEDPGTMYSQGELKTKLKGYSRGRRNEILSAIKKYNHYQAVGSS
jgi:7-cyano-7-deazaguanine synthase